MTLKYGLQVWDTQAFPLVELSLGLTETFDLPKLNAQRTSLMRQHAAPSQNILKFAESLHQQSETLSSVYPWITTYLQDLSIQFQRQSKAVLTIDIPKHSARFTILAYVVAITASQHHMVTYNAAGDFYILPLLTRLENSRFIDLYKNNIQVVPCTYVYGFMNIYRNALIAEKILKPEDLIDWDQYDAVNNFNCEFEARDMVQQRVIANFLERGIVFNFQEQTRYFTIPIKKIADISYFLGFKFSVAIEEQGTGRIMITPYITVVCDQISLKIDLILAHANQKLQQIFDQKIDSLSVSALWSGLDLRNNCKANFFVNKVPDYITWPELFKKIDQLIDCSASVISDINSIEYFLDALKCILDTGAKLNETVGFVDQFKEKAIAYFCCLIYCKLFKHDLLPEFSKQLRIVYAGYEREKEIYDFIDEIQNYELPPS